MGNDLKKEATCSTCLKILNKPVLLPCQCSSICHEHIDELKRVSIENSLTCKQCTKTFDLKNATFAENQILNNKIKSMEYLSSRKRQTFAFVQNKLEQIEKILNEYEEKLNEFTMKIVDHFYNIKNAIDIRRETMLEEIYNKNKNEDLFGQRLAQDSNELIKRIEQGEETFLRIFNLKVKSNLYFIIEEILNEVIDEVTLLQESKELIERTEQGHEKFLSNFNLKAKSTIDEVNLEHERNRIFEFFRKTRLSKEDLENLEDDFNFKIYSLSGILERFDAFQAILAQNYFKPYADKKYKYKHGRCS